MTSSGKVQDRTDSIVPHRHAAQGFHYVWAVGKTAIKKASGRQVAARYQVGFPQIWLDTKPEQDPDVPAQLFNQALPYLHLYPYRLHVPEVYGVCRDDETDEEILLLENVPLTSSGALQPSIAQAWIQATATRQAYWLWQLLELWQPFCQLDVAASLLSLENIRVEGWRVRLKELIEDETVEAGVTPSLTNLADSWLTLLPNAKEAIVQPFQAVLALMQAPDTEYGTIATALNQLLIEQAAKLPLRLQVLGATEVGAQRSHNEDAYYPISTGAKSQAFDDLTPRLTIVCDGIGGHDGGEVASQLAVQTIQLQVRALLSEIAGQPEPVPPELIREQLAAIVRVVNNVIAAQNDAQNRQARRRMGTTLTMALQIPQRVKLSNGMFASNAHELYLVNVGDSRAYWITPNYCQQLTVDDDVAVREVRMGRSLYREALKRPDSGALTQALGTRDGQLLYPTVQRFILEEDGILLLCSDGMSDNGFVEQSWSDYAELILLDKFPLETAVQSWLEFANQHNGHDNASIVLTHCQISSPLPDLRLPIALDEPEPDEEPLPDPIVIPPAEPQKPRSKPHWWLKGLLLLSISGAVGAGVWYYRDPVGMQQTVKREFETIRNGAATIKDRIQHDLIKR